MKLAPILAAALLLLPPSPAAARQGGANLQPLEPSAAQTARYGPFA